MILHIKKWFLAVSLFLLSRLASTLVSGWNLRLTYACMPCIRVAINRPNPVIFLSQIYFWIVEQFFFRMLNVVFWNFNPKITHSCTLLIVLREKGQDSTSLVEENYILHLVFAAIKRPVNEGKLLLIVHFFPPKRPEEATHPFPSSYQLAYHCFGFHPSFHIVPLSR